MKTITLLLLIALTSQVSAQSISLIQECAPEKSSCDLLKDYDTGKENAFHGSIQERLRILKKDIKSVTISKAKNGSTINIVLNNNRSQELQKLTARSIAKKLFVVVDGAVLSAPVVREAITGGNIMISLPEGESDLSEKLKWLRELSKVTAKKGNNAKSDALTNGLTWSAVILIGTLCYAFLPRKKSKKDA